MREKENLSSFAICEHFNTSVKLLKKKYLRAVRNRNDYVVMSTKVCFALTCCWCNTKCYMKNKLIFKNLLPGNIYYNS